METKKLYRSKKDRVFAGVRLRHFTVSWAATAVY